MHRARVARGVHHVTVVADQIAQLEAAIAAQDELRPALGDAAVDTAVSALRAQLEALRSRDTASPQPAWVPAPEEALAQLQSRVPAALADKARVTGTSRRAEGERRNVTVLFADLSGFTALSERFDPEIIREFQHDLFDEMASVVYEYEGFVEKFVGDAIVSVFGAPLTHEDDPERALRAALAIRERMEGVNQRWVKQLGQPLTIHIGINSGTVVAGEIGAEHGGGYAVTGDTINTASRLQDAAKPGQILVSLNTHRLAHEAFAFRRLKPLRVHGKREPLTVFELRRAKLYPGKSRGVRGLSAPIVGRGIELEQLQRVTDGLVAGSGRVVIITGEAGIGKSRLMMEWHASLGREVRWLEGRSYAGASAVPYGPFADLSRRYAGITDEDSELRARSRLREALKRVLPADLEANAIVAGMLGMRPESGEADYLATLSSQTLKQRLFALIEGLFTRLAQERPTILVLEDLHWADGSSLELTQHLLPLVRRLPLAIVGVFRRGQDEVPLWPLVSAEYGDRLTRLELAPLPDTSTVTLVEKLLSTSELLPPAAQDLIIGKAEGNPFFVEEVIRSLIERGALVRSAEHGGRWIATPLIDSIRVPDTLQGVLMARLDRLPAETRRIAQLAAVIGRIFQYRVLIKLAESAAGLEADLGQLEREELIHELRRDPELEYIFKHALTQEVAYESLLVPQRRDLHARVGAAMEELVTDRIGEFQAVLGGHFLRGENWEKACAYFIQAGDAATRLHAHPEASLHYDKALQGLAQLPVTIETRRQLVDVTLKQVAVSWGAHETERNLAMLREAETVAQALSAEAGSTGPDRVRLARVHYWMGRIHYYRSEPRDAIGYFQQVLAVAEELHDEDLLAIPAAVMGRALILQGHFGRAEALLARAVGPLAKSEDWQEWSYTNAFLGVALAARGDYSRGLKECERALSRAEETDNPTAIAGCLTTFCFLRLVAREGPRLREAGRATAEAAGRAGNQLLVYAGLAWEAWGLSKSGQRKDAAALMAQAQAVAETIGGRLVIADWFAAANAELALSAGHARQAIDRARDAVEIARAVGGIFGEAMAQRVWGEALAQLRSPRQEESDLHMASSLELFETADCKVEMAHTHLAWGLLLRGRGDGAAATDHLQLAADQFEAAGLVTLAEQARASLAHAR
jgi:class 3 adenylate cyclase/tetratricopeptide (TPR) repeat protein